MVSPENVLIMGAGHAGQRLYASNLVGDPAFRGMITLCDPDAAKLDPAYFGESHPDVATRLIEAHRSGRLRFTDTVHDVPTPGILIVATTPGTHLAAYQQAVGRTGQQPPATIFEKVFLTPEEEQMFNELVKRGVVNPAGILVNETRALTSARLPARSKAAELLKQGGELISASSVMYKNRGTTRFDDPVFGPYGIEATHGITALAGILDCAIGVRDITSNTMSPPGEPGWTHTEFTITRAGKKIPLRVAQGLGAFTIDQNGERTPNEKPGVVRVNEIVMSNGIVRVQFDPLNRTTDPYAEPFSTKLSVHTPDREELSRMYLPDDTIRALLRGADKLHRNGRSGLPSQVGVDYALKQAQLLRYLNTHAN